jgi:hypothetical protein
VRDEGGHVPLQVGHLVEEGGEMGQQQRQIARDLAQMWAQHIHPVEHARQQRREALEVPGMKQGSQTTWPGHAAAPFLAPEAGRAIRSSC